MLPSGSFFGIDLLAFPRTQHGIRRPNGVARDRTGIFRKTFLSPKIAKNGQKSLSLIYAAENVLK